MKKHITAFYLETLALIVMFLGVLLILTRVFGMSRAQSERAGQVTSAVNLAERAAEAVASSDSLDDVKAFFDTDAAAAVRGGVLEIEDEDLRAEVTWEPDGALIRSRITVYCGESEVYSLQTATGGGATP